MEKRLARFTSLALTLSLLLGIVGPVASARFEPTIPWDELDPEVLDYAYWNTALSFEERAADLISHMTLAEKVLQVNSHPKVAGASYVDQHIPRLGVPIYGYPGENLNGIANTTLWWRAYSDKEKNGELTATSFPSTMGQGSTWNPALIGEMGDAIGTEARVYYNPEVSGKGLSHWGPSVNLARDPRWGRTGDSFAEDGLISGVMATEFVKGFQGDYDTSVVGGTAFNDSDYIKAIACIKHFAANNAETTRLYGSSNMSEAELREYYLRHFGYMVRNGKTECVMAGYNAINGVPCHANYELLTSILRHTWGFQGWVVADNGGPRNLNNNYGVGGANATNADRTDRTKFPVLNGVWNGQEYLTVSSLADAFAAFLKAGGSIDLGNGTSPVVNGMLAIEAGTISEAQLDEMLLDVFTSRFATGEFDKDFGYFTDPYFDSIKNAMVDHADLAEQVATESIVLLENDGVLPLSKSNNKDYETIYIIGDDSCVKSLLFSDYASANSDYRQQNFNRSFLDALTEYCTDEFGVAPTYLPLTTGSHAGDGTPVEFLDTNDDTLFRNPNALDDKTLIIYIVGVKVAMMSNSSDAGEGRDRRGDTLSAPRGQDAFGDFILELANDAGADTVFMLHAQAMLDTSSWRDAQGDFKGSALLWAAIMGQSQGQAFVNVISGDAAPSGRLTTTWYKNADDLGELQHDYTIFPEGDSKGRTYMHFTGDITYPFGYGKSYAEFAYSNFAIDKAAVTSTETITVTVDVTNNSAVDSYEVVELYAVPPDANLTNVANKMLVGFSKVFVAAGETETATIGFVPFEFLARWDEGDKRFELTTGEYELYLGSDCETKITGCDGAFEVSADSGHTLQAVTLTPDAMILKNVGATANVTVTAALTNDKLFEDQDAVLGAGMTIAYTTGDSSVATIGTTTGKITAVGEGVTTVTATVTYDGGTMTGTHAIVVQKGTSGITISQATATKYVGETLQLTAQVTPADATGGIIWSTSDATRATVTQTGLVTILDRGTGGTAGTVTITAASGSFSKTCVITIPVIATGVTLDKSTASAYIGQTVQLAATVAPTGASQTVTWESSNTAVATVSGGLVIGVSAGTATITATSAAIPAGVQPLTATCAVTFNSLPSGGGGGSTTPTFTISAKAGEGGTITPSGQVSVYTGSDKLFTITAKDGYRIADVKVNGKSVGAATSYTFEKVTANQTIEATFAALGDAPAAGTLKFTDVPAGTWYESAVAFVTQQGLMNGISDTAFAPNINLSRAMVATILYRMAGSPEVAYAGTFSDVAKGAWYADAVEWAAGKGIVNGLPGGIFDPAADVTRQDMVTMLFRYAKAIEADTSNLADISRFRDTSAIPVYALEAMRWAVANGLINGMEIDGSFYLRPDALATRAEFASVMMRFCADG